MTQETVLEATVQMNSVLSRFAQSGNWEIGEMVGKYEIKELLGQGGLARVYKAYDKELDRYAALKVLRPGVAGSETAKKRFKQEVTLLAKLSQPGCISVFEAGEHNGALYCAMEYVEGETLRDLIRNKSIDLNEGLRILVKTAGIVAELHRRGLEHRDIKPANIMINRYGDVILLDFGLAKAMAEEMNVCVTSHGELFCTPAYMSPEQGCQENMLYRSGSSDVYSLGVTGFEIFTGTLPYDLENLTMDEMYYIIRNEKPKSICKLNKKVSSRIEKAINKALTKDPGKRIPAEEFYQELSEIDNSKKAEISAKRFAIACASLIAFGIIGALVYQVASGYHGSTQAPDSDKKDSVAEVVEKTTVVPVVKTVEKKTETEIKQYVDLPDIGLKLKLVKSGSFTMGEKESVHKVKISRNFYLGIHEVTIGQYAKITGQKLADGKKADLPVTNISWYDAVHFCQFLTRREKLAGRLPVGMVFRLPTEAEWEFACRAGSIGKYGLAANADELSDYAVHSGGKVYAVGSLLPDKVGIYDMLGNVWEWCYDVKGSYSSLPDSDPVAAGASYKERVIRGGSADSGSRECTSTYRRAASPHLRNQLIGFRVVLGSPIKL